jgi:hypothetical protein
MMRSHGCLSLVAAEVAGPRPARFIVRYRFEPQFLSPPGSADYPYLNQSHYANGRSGKRSIDTGS